MEGSGLMTRSGGRALAGAAGAGCARLCLFKQAELPPPAALLHELSCEQQERAEKFRKPLRRQQHVWSRLLLLAMARELGGASSCVEERPPRSPLIRSGDELFRTSVSHSAGRVACLVASAPCAIDIERLDPDRPFKRYIEVAFSREAAAALALEEDAAGAFYRAWGAYECAVKLGCPRAFHWERHAPVIEGLRVCAEIQDGWVRVMALDPALAGVQEREVSAQDIEGALLEGGALMQGLPA